MCQIRSTDTPNLKLNSEAVLSNFWTINIRLNNIGLVLPIPDTDKWVGLTDTENGALADPC